MNKGLFICLEHIDGAGGTTQASMLQEYLMKNTSCAVIRTFEPSDVYFGNYIRGLLKEGNKIDNHTLAGMFVIDRKLHSEMIASEVSKGNVVICDRYIYSNMVYNSDSIDDMDYIWNLNKNFIQPDITLFIRTSVNTSLNRMSNRTYKDIYENKDYLESVLNKYNLLADKGLMIPIDGNRDRNFIHNDIVKEVKKLL